MDDQISGHGFLPVYTGSDTSHISTGLRRNAAYKFRLQVNISPGLSKYFINFRNLLIYSDPHSLQNFQSNTTVCLIIPVFCKCREPEIVLPVLQIQKKDNFTFVNLTKRMNNQTNCSIALEILRKIWICLVFM